ncbi:MAG TPA: bifunctional UDP-N-acetylglucosamine diphosphorylase/glucosamine-1-phosphate N-acetyltransferase GlmU [Caulobacterales bacterium]|nr:bifunctional UDP-N-acetylglucosamine diphosphorylase/glucosamine-1-phosphate N-acetyltransferase GlmU [Caulobacterales bacterium]
MSRARAAIILAAGLGTRMKSELPKVLHHVGGRPMLDWAIAAAEGAGCAPLVIVTGVQSSQIKTHLAADQRVRIAIQGDPLGTAHAVRAAEASLQSYSGDVIVMYGDAPLVRAETLEAMFAKRAEKGGIVVLGFETPNPTGYGRLVLAPDGTVSRIVEEKDASVEERAISLCNSGVVCADGAVLFQLLSMVRNENAKGEYYLTDIVGLGRSAGFATTIVHGDEAEVLGVNSRVELAAAEAAFQAGARRLAMEGGVTLIDPGSVFFSFDTQIANDVTIEPNVFFGPGVKVARGVRIKANGHFEGAEIGEGAIVGPFARLRPGAKIGAAAHVGNFVEVKNATLGEGAKANHLSYLGDADIGARANIGAGTITCNYDGFNKYRTTIGEEAFIGSDTALVAPVKVGARAYTGSGSVITKDVPDGALAVARGRQRDIEGWADAFRDKNKKPKS